MRPAAVLILVIPLLASAQDWGSPANGLRVALAVEKKNVVVTFHAGREMYLPLGRTVGIGRADFVQIQLILADGTRRQLQYTGGSGLAPGRLLPYIIPMMRGSTYSVQTPLHYWRNGADLRQIDADLARGAALQATIEAPRSLQWQYVDCYGLQMFWSGRAASRLFRSTERAR